MGKVKIALEPKGVEGLPLPDLIQLGEKQLVEGQVIQRASSSPLYQGRWSKAGVDAETVRARGDLRRLPFATAADVVEAQKRHPLRRFPASRVSVWFASESQGEGRKWFPYGKQDVLRYMGLLARLGQVTGLTERDVILFVVPLAPRVTNAMPYLWMYTDILETKLKLEFVVGSMFLLGSSNWRDSFALFTEEPL